MSCVLYEFLVLELRMETEWTVCKKGSRRRSRAQTRQRLEVTWEESEILESLKGIRFAALRSEFGICCLTWAAHGQECSQDICHVLAQSGVSAIHSASVESWHRAGGGAVLWLGIVQSTAESLSGTPQARHLIFLVEIRLVVGVHVGTDICTSS